MKAPNRKHLLALALAPMLALGACNSQKSTEELVNAKLEAEKAKQLATEVQDLKATNAELSKENEALKLELATLRGRAAATAESAARVATAKPARKPGTAQPAKDSQGSQPSPAELQNMKEEATGGSSFK